MTEIYTDYMAPPEVDHQQVVVSLESTEGRIVLRENRYGHGFSLGATAEGFGAGSVENELIPRLRARGAMLGTQRQTEADMFLPIMIKSTSATEVRRLVAEMTRIMKLADGLFKVVVFDPATGQTRYRDVAYREGLATPQWSSPKSVKYGLTADYLDPWAYARDGTTTRINAAPSQGSAGWVAPFVFPLVSGSLGGSVDGRVDNAGDRPAPLVVTFAGQVTEPRIRNRATGAVVGVTGSLAWDERITVDALNQTVELWRTGDPENRQSVPGRLIRGTRLSKMAAEPGRNSYEFRSQTATDAFVEISAHSAFSALV